MSLHDTVLFQKRECCFLVTNQNLYQNIHQNIYQNIVAPNFLHQKGRIFLFQMALQSALQEWAFLHLAGAFLEMRWFIPLSTVRIWEQAVLL